MQHYNTKFQFKSSKIQFKYPHETVIYTSIIPEIPIEYHHAYQLQPERMNKSIHY